MYAFYLLNAAAADYYIVILRVSTRAIVGLEIISDDRAQAMHRASI